MATKADLRISVLKELGVLAAGDTASAEDAAHVDEAIDRMQGQFEDQYSAYWLNDDFPAEIVIPLTKIVAYQLGPSYGISDQRMATFKFREQEGWADLWRHNAIRRDDSPVEGVYF